MTEYYKSQEKRTWNEKMAGAVVVDPSFKHLLLACYKYLIASRAFSTGLTCLNIEKNEFINISTEFLQILGGSIGAVINNYEILLDYLEHDSKIFYLQPVPTHESEQLQLLKEAIKNSDNENHSIDILYPTEVFLAGERRDSFISATNISKEYLTIAENNVVECSNELKKSIFEYLIKKDVDSASLLRANNILKNLGSDDLMAGRRDFNDKFDWNILLDQIIKYRTNNRNGGEEDTQNNQFLIKSNCTASSLGNTFFNNDKINQLTSLSEVSFLQAIERLKSILGSDFEGGVISPIYNVEEEESYTIVVNDDLKSFRALFYTSNYTNSSQGHIGNLIKTQVSQEKDDLIQAFGIYNIIWYIEQGFYDNVEEFFNDPPLTFSGDFAKRDGSDGGDVVIDVNAGRMVAPMYGYMQTREYDPKYILQINFSYTVNNPEEFYSKEMVKNIARILVTKLKKYNLQDCIKPMPPTMIGDKLVMPFTSIGESKQVVQANRDVFEQIFKDALDAISKP
jgi:hypothetical protein